MFPDYESQKILEGRYIRSDSCLLVHRTSVSVSSVFFTPSLQANYRREEWEVGCYNRVTLVIARLTKLTRCSMNKLIAGLHTCGRSPLRREDRALVQGLRVFQTSRCLQTRKESGHLRPCQSARQRHISTRREQQRKIGIQKKGVCQATGLQKFTTELREALTLSTNLSIERSAV